MNYESRSLVSWMDWEKLINSVVVDLRSPNEFSQGHILNSANIPAVYLEPRMHELPSKEKPITLIGNIDQLEIASSFLLSKGYSVSDRLRIQTGDLEPNINPRYCVSGSVSNLLWSPSGVVKEFVKMCGSTNKNLNGIDLACGAGRDSIYLARKGWKMSAVDYSKSALDKVRSLAAVNQVSVKAIQLDLEKDFSAINALGHGFDAIVTVRYLHRPILTQLSHFINTGGYIIYQTFLRGAEKIGSPKNPRFLLEAGELADIFSDFEILVDDIEYLGDGRPTNRFIARKHSAHL